MRLPVALFVVSMFSTVAYGQLDLKATRVYPVDYLPVGTHRFDVMIKNAGTTVVYVNSYKIGWQVDNGPAMEAATVTPQYGLFVGQEVRVTGNFDASFTTAGTHKLKVWTRSISVPDINTANDTVTQTVKVIAALPPKNVLMEVFKHQGCCPCVDAGAFEDSVVSHDPKYAIANIYCSTSDVIYNADGDVINDIFSLPHPNVFFDRYLFPHANKVERSFYSLDDIYMLTDMDERERYYEPIGVSFVSASFNNTSRLLKVKLKAKIYDTISGDHRFNLYLTEDSIMAYQECALPDPNSYYHMHVLRHMFGSTWGQAGSLPSMLYPGDEKFFEFQYNVPAGYRLNQLDLIGLVQRYDNADSSKRRILNSAKIRFSDALTLDIPKTAGNNDQDVELYPNPATDKVYIRMKAFNGQPIYAAITDMSGRSIRNFTIDKNETIINISDLSTGSYFIKLADNTSQRSYLLIRK